MIETDLNEKTKENKVTVVIIEDYALTRVGLKTSLEEFDFINVIGEASDGNEGVKVVNELKPDVVLMDLGLAGMNGIEATSKIVDSTPQTAIIALTSHDREDEVMAMLGAGARGYCLKDIDPYTLSGVIRSVAQGACWLDPGIAKWALNQFPRPKDTAFMVDGMYTDSRTQLTERELEVLRLLVAGKSNTEIASELIVSVHTAKAHVCSILQKLCVDDRVQAAVKAIKENIV